MPWIALVGYPTLACAALLVWGWVRRRVAGWGRQAVALLALLAVLALAHAWGLQALKDRLGW